MDVYSLHLLLISPLGYLLTRFIYILGYIGYITCIVVPITSIMVIYFTLSLYIMFEVLYLYTEVNFSFMNTGSNILFLCTFMNGFVCDKPKSGVFSKDVIPANCDWRVEYNTEIKTSSWSFCCRNNSFGVVDIKTWNMCMDLPLLFLLVYDKIFIDINQWTMSKEILLYGLFAVLILRQPVAPWNFPRFLPFMLVSILEVSFGMFLLYSHFIYKPELN